MKIIRSSRHFYSNNNKVKTENIRYFLHEYKQAVQNYIDFLWENPLSWETKTGVPLTFDLSKLQMNCPKCLDYQIIKFETKLSARALSSAATQALGIVKSKTNDVKKRQFALSEAVKNGKQTQKLETKLQNTIKRLKKPYLSDRFKAELSSKNLLLEPSKNAKHFEYWLDFHALGFQKPFSIPIKIHKQDKILMGKNFNFKGSFLVGKDYIEIRYEKEISKRETGEIIGCDTGIKTVAYFSHQDNDINIVNGLTYEMAVARCARKRKGSKNFQQAMTTRNNIIHTILNRINFDNVKQINLEDNSTLKFGKRTSKYLKHHAYGVIKDKIKKVAEELGVQVQMQTSHYKSQRCFACGWTQKSNRKQEVFHCQRCEYEINADKNASDNNKIKLCWLDFSSISKQKLNHSGFEWLVEVGEEFGVPHLDLSFEKQ